MSANGGPRRNVSQDGTRKSSEREEETEQGKQHKDANLQVQQLDQRGVLARHHEHALHVAATTTSGEDETKR
jgi:hypothetical protein